MYTDAQLDGMVRNYRLMTIKDFAISYHTNPEFKALADAAYYRGMQNTSKNFTEVDEAGWRLGQTNVKVDPTRPSTGRDDVFGAATEEIEAKNQPIPGAAFPT